MARAICFFGSRSAANSLLCANHLSALALALERERMGAMDAKYTRGHGQGTRCMNETVHWTCDVQSSTACTEHTHTHTHRCSCEEIKHSGQKEKCLFSLRISCERCFTRPVNEARRKKRLLSWLSLSIAIKQIPLNLPDRCSFNRYQSRLTCECLQFTSRSHNHQSGWIKSYCECKRRILCFEMSATHRHRRWWRRGK